MKQLTLLLCMSLIVLAPACQVTKVTHGIPNLRQVEPGVWRGGQPTDEGWAWLKANGVTNVIKLNPESEASDETAERLGMRVVRCPITTQQQFIGPVAPQLEQGLLSITDRSFVHCEFGMNRTGTLIMLYRRQVCGWSKQRAENEANQFGWDTSFPALKAYWERQK